MIVVIDDDSNPLKAEFNVEPENGGFSITVESRGGAIGSSNERNADYIVGLERILARISQLGTEITDAVVESKTTARMGLQREDRRLQMSSFQYPIGPRDAIDITTLRKELCAAQRPIGRRPGARGPGNNTKRIRIYLGREVDLNLAALSFFIATGNPDAGEVTAPTADSALLDARVTAIRKTGAVGRPEGNQSPQRVAAEKNEIQRDPSVKAWVLEKAGDTCERCLQPAPFLGKDGKPFLEVHHVRMLAEGGPDTVENAVALCPNCHRRCHYSSNSKTVTKELIKSIDRLRPS